MGGEDWTVALDAALTGRLLTCTQCGGPYQSAWLKVYRSDTGLTLPVAQCRRCQTQDPDGTALTAKLDARYPVRS